MAPPSTPHLPARKPVFSANVLLLKQGCRSSTPAPHRSRGMATEGKGG